MAWPTISSLGTVPSRTQDPATFSSNANSFLGNLPTFRTELNAFGSYGDTFETTMAGYETGAEAAQTAAETAQTAAENAEDAALAAANFAGNWSALTGALNVPASVYHNGATWLLLTNLADVTASEPSFSNSDWGIASGYLENIASVTGTGSVAPSKNTLYYTGSLSGDATTTLPAVANSTGLTLMFKKMEASHTWTIDGNGSETIDGATTFDLSDQYSFVVLVCNGTTWHILGQTSVPTTANTATTGVTSFTSGSGTWTVPAEVYQIDITSVGAGASGALGDRSNQYYVTGGGGGGTVTLSVRVSPGDEITYSVGSGGAAVSGTSNQNGNSGGDSTCSLSGVFSITAYGGGAGIYSAISPNTRYTNTTSLGGGGIGGFVQKGGSGVGDSSASTTSATQTTLKGGDSARGSGAYMFLGPRTSVFGFTGVTGGSYGGGGSGSFFDGGASGSSGAGAGGLVEFRYTINKV